MVLAAARYLRENAGQTPGIAQVARIHGFSPSHFSVIFRKCHGISAKAYLQKMRMEKARLQLLNTGQGLKEIANECGFADAAHFCRSFKETNGLRPGQFRRTERIK